MQNVREARCKHFASVDNEGAQVGMAGQQQGPKQGDEAIAVAAVRADEDAWVQATRFFFYSSFFYGGATVTGSNWDSDSSSSVDALYGLPK